MDPRNLKQMLNRDIERLKTMEIDILDSKIFYRESLRNTAISFLFSWGTFAMMYFLPTFFVYHEFRFSIFPPIVDALIFLCLHFLAFSRISDYVIFKNCILNRLESGEYIKQKILLVVKAVAGFVFVVTSALTVVFTIIHFFPIDDYDENVYGAALGYILGIGLPTMFFSAVVQHVTFSRLGLSAFFSLMQSIVNKKRGFEIAEEGRD